MPTFVIAAQCLQACFPVLRPDSPAAECRGSCCGPWHTGCFSTGVWRWQLPKQAGWGAHAAAAGVAWWPAAGESSLPNLQRCLALAALRVAGCSSKLVQSAAESKGLRNNSRKSCKVRPAVRGQGFALAQGTGISSGWRWASLRCCRGWRAAGKSGILGTCCRMLEHLLQHCCQGQLPAAHKAGTAAAGWSRLSGPSAHGAAWAACRRCSRCRQALKRFQSMLFSAALRHAQVFYKCDAIPLCSGAALLLFRLRDQAALAAD